MTHPHLDGFVFEKLKVRAKEKWPSSPPQGKVANLRTDKSAD
jgi:hypothetical protein